MSKRQVDVSELIEAKLVISSEISSEAIILDNDTILFVSVRCENGAAFSTKSKMT